LVAYFRSTWENRIGGETDLRRATEAPVLGRIPFDQEAMKRPLLTQSTLRSPRAEAYRELRTNLQVGKISRRSKSVLITSSLPGEGRSTTAINLAIALAEAGQSVCLMDVDLRRPRVGEYLGLERKEGLTTALMGARGVGDLLQPWGDRRLFVLASGPIPPNPSELVDSEDMKRLLEHLESRFDAVILDAPPLLPFTDAAVLSQHVGGTVVVVAEQEVRVQDLERSLDALGMVTSNFLGVVLNRTTDTAPDHSYGYDRKDATIVNADVADTRPAKTGIGA
jgi:capsular exopolysaccharide synthesis family protein